jgi:hypothetical protein
MQPGERSQQPKEIKMNSNRKITIIAGVLFLIGTLVGILSVVPAIDTPDYLIKASANANQVVLGAIFQFVMAVVYIGIAITLYPVLRKYNENLALGFLSFRIIAAVFIIIGVICLLLLLALSREFMTAGIADPSYFHTFGNLLRTGRDLVNHVAMILALSVGGLMFNFLLYQEKLVPGWLSVFGFVGNILAILASMLVMFHIIDIITTVYMVLFLPIALQEMILAIWLIAKGFNSTAIVYAADE